MRRTLTGALALIMAFSGVQVGRVALARQTGSARVAVPPIAAPNSAPADTGPGGGVVRTSPFAPQVYTPGTVTVAVAVCCTEPTLAVSV